MSITLELDLARNCFGRIKPDARRRLETYAAAPTLANWRDVYCIIVGADGWMTVWQAWREIDRTAPRIGPTTDSDGRIVKDWTHWPDAATFRKALAFATH